ncbi:MAG: hypothetical protein EA377_13145 [Phycisphaerales bacterium]|nr:MAG: hypothetical protein EA377_13145 [Phycisphaerales bacterium]
MTIELEAADADDAQQQAAEMNLLVAAIEPAPMTARSGDEAPPTEPGRAESDLVRRVNAVSRSHPPDYFWLKLVGRALNILGCLTIGLTLMFNLLLLIGIIDLGVSQGNVAGITMAGGILVILNILGGVILGMITLALGQGLLAFRDIARNSWKLPQIADRSTQ